MGGLSSLFTRSADVQGGGVPGGSEARVVPQTPWHTRAIEAAREWHAGLPSPGTWENMHRDARAVSPAALLFDGAKAELAKGLGPSFQVSHAFSAGSAHGPPSYALGAVHVSGGALLHALVDGGGALQGKALWSTVSLSEDASARTAAPGRAAKATAQVHVSPRAGESMLQLEGDGALGGLSLNAKAINADPSDGMCGVYAVSALHALGHGLSVGAELVGQRFPAALASSRPASPKSSPVSARSPERAAKAYAFEHGVNVAARVAVPGAWALAASVQQQSALHASYHQRVSPAVDLATEVQAVFAGPRRDAHASVAARFDYRQACLRACVDTLGRVGMHYEERVFPGFSLLLSGELDHVRGSSRFGFGVSLEN